MPQRVGAVQGGAKGLRGLVLSQWGLKGELLGREGS